MRKRTAFALAAVCASAIPVSAQATHQGSFTVTHEVRRQNAILPAGDYTFEIKSLTLPALMTVKDPNGSQFVTTLAVDEEAGEQSMLIVENRGSGSQSVNSTAPVPAAACVMQYRKNSLRVRLRESESSWPCT